LRLPCFDLNFYKGVKHDGKRYEGINGRRIGGNF
jgi:hypothetical protein